MIHMMVRSSDHHSSQSPSNAAFQAITKALNPSALASLEHLHDAWQRSRCCGFFVGFEVSPHAHLWGEVMMICSLSSSDRSNNMLTSPTTKDHSAKQLLDQDLRRRRSGTVHCCRTAPCLSPMMCHVFACKLQWQLGSEWGSWKNWQVVSTWVEGIDLTVFLG